MVSPEFKEEETPEEKWEQNVNLCCPFICHARLTGALERSYRVNVLGHEVSHWVGTHDAGVKPRNWIEVLKNAYWWGSMIEWGYLNRIDPRQFEVPFGDLTRKEGQQGISDVPGYECCVWYHRW